MPRYQIIQVRALYSALLIDAENEEDARAYKGTIIDECETDTWGEREHSFEQVADDCESVELP